MFSILNMTDLFFPRLCSFCLHIFISFPLSFYLQILIISPFSADGLSPSGKPEIVLETEPVPAVYPAALPSESAPAEVSEAAVVMDQETPAAPPQSKI